MQLAPEFAAPVPVFCIGNFTGGGEGKTPMALAVAALLRDEGVTPGLLTRGYRGRETGPLVVDPARDGADRVGDEALLLARTGLTVLAADRASGARMLVDAGADAIVMDDGFQNPRLAKDFSFIVADTVSGLGNRMVMPSGPLRAPLHVQLQRTDALVVIGSGPARDGLVRLAARANRRVLRARLVPVDARKWDDRRVLAFAGIGRPEKFFATLEEAGARFAGRRAFPDHHVLTENEARTLLNHARGGGVRLVTTEKDLARLAGATGILAELRDRTEAFPVRLEFEDPALPRAMLLETIDRVRGRQRQD